MNQESPSKAKSSRIHLYLFVALCAVIVGILDSIFIFWSHDLHGQRAFCSQTGVFSCQALENPQYSTLFKIPWSLYSLLFYGFVFLFILGSLKNTLMNLLKSELNVLYAISTFALLPTIVLEIGRAHV